MKCGDERCDQEAKTAVGVGVYPPRCVMEHFGTHESLARMVLSLALCPDCFRDLERLGLFNLVPREQVKAFARTTEQITGFVIDLEQSRLTRVPLDDPQYLALLRARERHPVIAKDCKVEFKFSEVSDPERFGEIVPVVDGPERPQ